MITLTRRQVHNLRQVFRRVVLGIAHRSPIPPLVLEAQGTQLCVKHRYEALGVTCTLSGRAEPRETILLPLDALADFEGKQDTSVVLESAAPDRTVVRWQDRHASQSREYAVPEAGTVAAFPTFPESRSTAPAELLGALTAASETCDEADTRYALSTIQLRGKTSDIVATDGRQLLIQGGLRFPWNDDVLVRHAPIFASPMLPRDRAISIAKTDTHVVLRAGSWTLFLEIQKDVRFPEISHIVPGPETAATRLTIDDSDAAFLADTLPGLPQADDTYVPLTLELNGRVTLRTRGGDPERTTELVLNRSRFTGAPLRVNGERDFMLRALRLGFRDLEIQDAKSPIAARVARSIYVWQSMNPETAIEATDDAIRIESSPGIAGPVAREDEIEKERTVVHERTTTAKNGAKTSTGAVAEQVVAAAQTNGKVGEASNGPGTTDTAGPTSLTALIKEAEALHEVLSDAKTRFGRLVISLRRHRKQSRLLQDTLRSLRQLQLQDVTE